MKYVKIIRIAEDSKQDISIKQTIFNSIYVEISTWVNV